MAALGILAALAFVGLGLLAVFRAPTLPLVFLAVGATEVGHWFAGVALLLAALSAPSIASGLFLAAAALLLTPAFRAARFSPAFRWRDLLRLSINHHPSGERMVIDGPGGPLGIDFFPAEAPNAPLVVVAHGGGWMAGNSQELAGWHRWLAARGYAVASVNYRLVPTGAWPAQRDDILAAVDHLRANAADLDIDPDRIVLFGRSAGGQIVSAIAAPGGHPWLRGCVCLYTPFDMAFAYEHSRENDILRSRWLLRCYLGGRPDEEPAHYREASAYQTLQPGAPPFLLLHGPQDELVWFPQSERFAARLEELRVPHTFLALPWARHAFDFNLTGPAGQIFAATLAEFLERTCALASSPPSR
ncbi:MAG TPA: alpha/beta hydrolase [Chthoniobacterales bacterium]